MEDDPLAGARVLLIEDHPLNNKLFTDLFVAHGAEPVSLHRVLPGVHAIGEREFDLILVDDYLPDGTAMTLLDAANDLDLTTPIIVLTAHLRPGKRADWMDAGAWGYIEKPITVLAFLEQVREALMQDEDENEEDE